MDIIKNNNGINLTCDKCRSELKFFLSDVCYYENLGHGNGEFSIVCAACDKRLYVDSVLPRSWKVALDPPETYA